MRSNASPRVAFLGLVLTVLWLQGSLAAAQPASLVKDIHTGLLPPSDRGSFPDQIVEAGGVIFFTASDRIHGLELWRTDGTAAGTFLIRDIFPGPFGSSPTELIEFRGELYFKAMDGSRGFELWKSDGTTEGTVLVADVEPEGSSDPYELTVLGDHLYFTAFSHATGEELWRTDGTAAGTELVLDANPGPESSFFSFSVFPEMIAAGDALYYAAWDEAGLELWRSDGTAAGTARLADVYPGAESSHPAGLAEAGGVVYFRAFDNEAGGELWKTDGTTAGTVSVGDLRPGPGSSNPNGLAEFGGALFFTADAGQGPEIWKATGAGITPLIPLGGVTTLGEPQFQALGGHLFFRAGDARGYELWKTDGTPEGTSLVADIHPGAGSSFPEGLTVLGSELFFRAADSVGDFELWRSDGTAAGTAEVVDLGSSFGGSDPGGLAGIGGVLYFHATDGGILGFELWRSDGTAAGTRLVADLNPAAGSAFFNFSFTHPRPVELNGLLITVAFEEATGFELWRSDGTAAGTFLVADLRPGPDSGFSTLSRLARAGGFVYFIASESGVPKLWRTDGTAAGTVPVTDLCFGCSGGEDLEGIGSKLFFTLDGPGGREPWTSDGTAAGTGRLADINPGPGGSFPTGFTAAGGTVFFTASDGVTGFELWKTDGTTAGTVRVTDLNPGPAHSSSSQLVAFKGALYLTATDGVRGAELWRTDGTAAGTVLVKDIHPPSTSPFVRFVAPRDLTAAGNLLFFVAGGLTPTGSELWRSDGTPGGTFLVRDILPGPGGSLPGELTAVGPKLLFAASDGLRGQELWVSDGTVAGTRMVQDIAPGVQSSIPTYPTVAGANVFFIAYQPETGRELWKLPRAALSTPVERIADLIVQVQALRLHHGIEDSLLVKLREVQQLLTDADSANDASARGNLGAFIHHLRAQRGKKIPTAAADALIAEAEGILAMLE